MKKLSRLLFATLITAMVMLLFSSVAVATDMPIDENHVHTYETKIEPATTEKDGYYDSKCTTCPWTEAFVIPKIATVKLSQTEYVFDGGPWLPSVIAFDSEGEELFNSPYDGYTIKYPSDSSKVGTHKYVITFNGKYKGQVTLSYKVVSPFSAPKLKTISSTTKGVKLEWSKVKNCKGYEVYRKTESTSWKKIGETKTCEYVDSTAVYNKTYQYTVKAYGEANGHSVKSDYNKTGLSVKVKKVTTPAAPTATLKSKNVSLKWKAVSGATEYRVYRATSKKGEYKLIYTAAKNKLTYTDKKVTLGKTYYYKIKACVGSKASPASSYTKILITVAAPKFNKKVTTTSKSVTFSWSKIDKADYYTVYRKKNINDSWKKIGTVKAGKSLKYTVNVKSGYCYSVAAFHKLSSKKTIKGLMAEEIYVNPIGKPASLTLEADAISKTVFVRASMKNKNSEYQLYCKEGKNGKWKCIEEASVGSDDLLRDGVNAGYHHSVKLGKTYYYKIRGVSKKSNCTVYGPFSEVKELSLYFNPDVKVVLPKKSSGTSSFPIKITNNGSKTLRVYGTGYLSNGGDAWHSGDMYLSSVDGKILNRNYYDIPAGKTVTAHFLPEPMSIFGGNIPYSKKSYAVLYFRYNGKEYASSYSNYYGKGF